MNVVAEIQRINERELALGVGFEASWHQKYKDSAWVYVGGLAFELSEGDVICVMSQFGEIEDLNLVRDGKTGKSKGFAFVKYENWLSTVLAVDNMNGATLLERTIRVDHVLKYKLPKEVQDRENEKEARLLESSDDESQDGGKRTKEPSARGLPGHAYEGKELATQFDIAKGQNVFDAPRESDDEKKSKKHKKKKDKKDKKDKKEKKKKTKEESAKTVEQRQAEWMEHVKRQRELRREQEEQARALAGDGGAAQPSETGWRGRLEPTERAPRPPPRDGDASSYDERERKRRAGFGGIDRVR